MATTWNPADLRTGYITLSNGNLTASASGGQIVSVAADLTANRMWVWSPLAARWNGAVIGSQNPATGTGGFDISYITGAKFPAWSAFNGTNGDICVANFGAATFAQSPPSGFSAWNTLAGTTTWNPSDKSANISLSNGNLTATAVTTASAFRSVRATTSLSSGKAYFEVLAQTIDTNNGFMVAIGNTTAPLTNFIGFDLNGIGYQAQGGVWKNNTTAAFGSIDVYNGTFWRSVRGTTSAGSGKLYFEITASAVDTTDGFIFGLANAGFSLFGTTTYVGGDINSVGFQKQGNVRVNNTVLVAGSGSNGYTIGATPAVAVDLGAQKIWFLSTQTGLWNNGAIGAQNPATGVGGFSITALGSPLYPVFAGFAPGTDTGVLNAGATAFVNAVPAGFSAWDAGGGGGATAQARAVVMA